MTDSDSDSNLHDIFNQVDALPEPERIILAAKENYGAAVDLLSSLVKVLVAVAAVYPTPESAPDVLRGPVKDALERARLYGAMYLAQEDRRNVRERKN